VKKVLTYIILLLLLVIQTSAGSYIRVFNVLPSPALVFTIIYSLTNGSFKSAALGLVCGLLFDATSSGVFGFNSFLVMYLCISASLFSRKYYYENKLATVCGVFLFTVIYETLTLIFTVVLFSKAPFFYSFFRYILPEALINSIIAIPVLMCVKWLNNEYIRGI